MMDYNPQIKEKPKTGLESELMDWKDVANTIWSHIKNQDGAKSWEQSTTDATITILNDLTNKLENENDKDSSRRATLEFQNAVGETKNYMNVPFPRNDTDARTHLENADNQTDYAIHSLDPIGVLSGLPSLHTWLLTSELFITIKQEWLVFQGQQSSQININTFYDYMVQHFNRVRDTFLQNFQYCVVTNDSGVRIYFYCGKENPHFPSEDENTYVNYVAFTDGLLEKLKIVKH